MRVVRGIAVRNRRSHDVISGALHAFMTICAAQSHIVEKSELARLALSLRSERLPLALA